MIAIKITLPQVNNKTLWKPRKISVNAKLKISTGRYLNPKKAGI